jgi:hypothetical protein
MPFTKYANLDFDQIKTSIKDYLRSNSNFTDFDFEGSNIGYIPRSRTAATAQISFNVTTTVDTPTLTLKAGIVCVGTANDTTFTFSIIEDITANTTSGPINSDGSPTFIASFNNIDVCQGIYLTKQFLYDGSLDQRFILNNSFIDTSKLKVYISKDRNTRGIEYSLSKNIFNVDKNSRVFFISEIQDEKYELRFGDGLIGKKLGENGDGTYITANYVITDGKDGNGASSFSFSGTLESANETIIDPDSVTITTNQTSSNGGDIEPIDSVKYFAPKLYSSQYRAVTSRDYEAIIKEIYPNTESVSVVGGEQLDPPQFGTVQISIKPKNGSFVSDFDKIRIASDLKQYTVSGINQKITDLKILYVELDSSVYYNYSQSSSEESLKTSILNSLTKYSKSLDLNKFGGRLRYSKVQQVIDNTDTAITSNITKIIIRRDLKVALNTLAQYELCYGNRFHVKSQGFNIKSTGFKIVGESSTVYLTDTPNLLPNLPSEEIAKDGFISLVKFDSGNNVVVIKQAGTINYEKGEIILFPINITETTSPNNIIEIQAFPESNDVVGLRDLYVSLNIPKSTINMVRDVIASGDEISGTRFVSDFYNSSYSNGNLIRK